MLCKGVICQKQELLCELLLAIDESEPKSDYVETKLNQVSGFLSPIFFLSRYIFLSFFLCLYACTYTTCLFYNAEKFI